MGHPAGFFVEFGNARRKFRLDAQGRLLSAEGVEGSVVFSHNVVGLPVEVRADGAPTIRYAYDVQDRLVEMRIGQATAIRYRYDYLGRLAVVATPAGDITYDYYRATNTVIRRLPNGVRTIREYDDEGKLVELAHVDSNNYIIVKYAYGYRPDGLIEGITEQNQRNGKRVCRYEYDLMQRLTAIACQGNGRAYRYRYDSLGNLTESQTADGEVLRFSSTPAGALAHDSRGTSRIDERGHIRQLPGAPVSIDYDFNGAGELAAAKGQSLQYTYNALGLLTVRTVNGRETRYLPDPFADAWHPLWRHNANGKEDVIVWDGAVPLVELRDKEVHYRLEDHLGSVRVEVDGRGAITVWHDYTPYGVPEEAAAGSDLIPAFAGLFWDPVARVYLTKARAYDPITARFLQPDPQLRTPSASKHSHSLYAYSGGDPVNFVDRNGAEAVSLDAHAVWWDAFWRTLTGNSAIDRGPTERDSVIKEVFDNAMSQARIDLTNRNIPITPETLHEATDSIVRKWRYQASNAAADGKGIFAKTPYYTQFKNATSVTPHEWQIAENYAYVKKQIITGKEHKMFKGGVDIPEQVYKFAEQFNIPRYKVDATMMGFKDVAWKAVRVIGERSNPKGWGALGKAINVDRYLLPPDLPLVAFSKQPAIGTMWDMMTGKQKVQPWLSQTPKRHEWFQRARKEAIAIKAAEAQFSPPMKIVDGDNNLLRDFSRNVGGGWVSTAEAAPSPVGGVYLGGAGKVLEGLGQLKGVAVDEATGKLLLIGSDEQQTALPPLRLDDVVTVFRGVYDYGQSPTVSIDPDEKEPRGPIMHVKHGPGTEGTYVGWILFECDRIMKTYQLGEDNVTRAAVNSQVPGYVNTLEAVFFGDRMHKGTAGSTWERFWIVPAAVRRFDATTTDLSLFELPLKVNTQKMRWKGGNLVDDEKDESSIGAKAFSAWFGEHYDEIAKEVLLTPPPGSGREAPVAIFRELRRIALIAAIAERLRDLGETLPLWMRDYPVASFPGAETTPSLTIEKMREDGSVIHTATIYGGVNLAPADKDVRRYSDTTGAKSATTPPEDVVFVDVSRQEVTSLASELPKWVQAGVATAKAQTIATTSGKKLSAAILPGADTRALAPNRQQATEMVVPIGLGRSIRLTRYYNSFFDPVGEYGNGWSLDLPELLVTKIPVSRDGKRSRYRVVRHLVSPLGTVDIRFDRTEHVEPYGVEMHVAKDHPEITGVAYGSSEVLGTLTQQVLFRDGTEWHFDDEGRLVLIQADGTATRYVRDSNGRVSQIVGYVGTKAVAEIRLGYDQQGRIAEAKAKQAEHLYKQAPAAVLELAFEYGDEGRLIAVTRSGVKEDEMQHLAYRYVDDRLAEITDESGADLSFGYSASGQLLWKKQGDWKREYTVSTTPQGTVLTVGTGDGSAYWEKWTYDTRLRPVTADFGGGHTVIWQYGKDNEMRETVYQADKTILTRSTSQDGNTETTVLTDGSTYELRRDAFGRPTTLSRDGILATQVSWRPDGKPGDIRAGETEIHPRWHENGWMNGVLISAPMKSGKTNNWLEEEWDLMGRPIKITDSSGFEYIMGYDVQGQLLSFGRLTDDGKVTGTTLTYNHDGQITGVDSSWSTEKREYADSGVLKRVEIERQGVRSVTTFDAYGRQKILSAFDGGMTTWRYDSEKAWPMLRAVELPNGARINYRWSKADETDGSVIRLGPAVFRMLSDVDGRVTTVTWGKQTP